MCFSDFSSVFLAAVLWRKKEGRSEDSRGALNEPQPDGNSRVAALANLDNPAKYMAPSY